MNMHVTPKSISEDTANAPLWAILMRSWLRVMIVAGLVGAMTFAALPWFTQPQFAATADISVPGEQGALAVVEALRSHDFAEKLVAELGLARDPAFNTAMPSNAFGRLMQAVGFRKPSDGDTAESRALVAYQRNLRVQPGREGQVTVEFVAAGPQLASRVVERLVEMYLDNPGETASAGGDTAAIARLTEAAAAADAAIEQFRTAMAARHQPPGAGEVDQAALAETVAQAGRDREAAEARARTVRQLLDRGNLEGIPDVHPSAALHELIAERVRTEVQKTAAERSLPAGHPRVRELQVKLSELRWQMFREATSIAEILDEQVAAATSRDEAARARLDRARGGVGDAAADAARLTALEADAAAKHAALKAAQAGERPALSAASGSGGTAPALVAPVEASELPVWPRKGPLALLAAVSTLMVGFVLVLLRELLAGARRAPGSELGERTAGTTQRDDVALSDRTVILPMSRDPSAVPPAIDAGQFAILSSTNDAARHIAALASERRGYRTLLVGDGVDCAAEARDLVSALASSGRRSVLVDWSRDGKGVATSLGLLPAQPGMNDLLAGHATFDDVIARLPESDAHIVACGAPAIVGAPLDPDWINLILDALDEAYDHVVVVSRLDSARALFEAIEGRFDAGIVISDRRAQGMSINAAPGVFLGFEVTDIYVVQLDVAQRSSVTPRRLRRGRRQAAVA